MGSPNGGPTCEYNEYKMRKTTTANTYNSICLSFIYYLYIIGLAMLFHNC